MSVSEGALRSRMVGGVPWALHKHNWTCFCGTVFALAADSALPDEDLVACPECGATWTIAVSVQR